MREIIQTQTENTYEAEQNKPKTFDILASVDLYRFDLQTAGYIRPETRQRVYNEELTFIAEGINRPLFTEFVLEEKNGQLVYFHKGRWRSYVGSLISNLELAEKEAFADSRRVFLANRAADDLKIAYRAEALEPGEKLVWYSDFPEQECRLYGEQFIGEECGFQPKRKMGFIYEIEKTIMGQTVMRSQSVDGSDKSAFEAAMHAGSNGGSIEKMRQAYDEVLSAKHEASFYAGRRVAGNLPEENAWAGVIRHRDLVEDYFLKEIENLAKKNLPRPELEREKKRLTYGVWAALKSRLESIAIISDRPGLAGNIYGISVQQEVTCAYNEVASRGEMLLGCGGSMKGEGEQALLSAHSSDVFESVFGKKISCPFCGAAQYGDPCASRIKCADCEAEVRDSRVVNKGNGGSRARKARRLGSFAQYWAELTEKTRRQQQEKLIAEENRRLERQKKLQEAL